jgi:hypothetical protein
MDVRRNPLTVRYVGPVAIRLITTLNPDGPLAIFIDQPSVSGRGIRKPSAAKVKFCLSFRNRWRAGRRESREREKKRDSEKTF